MASRVRGPPGSDAYRVTGDVAVGWKISAAAAVERLFAKSSFHERSGGSWDVICSSGYWEMIVEGIDNAPTAFIGLLRGENIGKMLVRVGPGARHPAAEPRRERRLIRSTGSRSALPAHQAVFTCK
jgi:hypothetical protein